MKNEREKKGVEKDKNKIEKKTWPRMIQVMREAILRQVGRV